MANNPTFGLPATQQITDGKTGSLVNFWYQFFVRIAQLSAERPIASVTLDPSPSVYTAFTIGHVFVTGGSGVGIVLGRSGVNLTCPENVFIPVAANDTVTITYGGAPTVTFIPSARA